MKRIRLLMCLLVLLALPTTVMAACSCGDYEHVRSRYTYAQRDSKYHWRTTYWTFKCSTCGDTYEEQWNTDYFAHEFSGNKCTLCGYTRSGGSSTTSCNHNDSSYHVSTPFGSLGYSKNTSTTHYVERHYKITCKVCGKVIDSDYVGRTTESHSFNSTGKCTKCGYNKGGSTRATATPKPNTQTNGFQVENTYSASEGKTTIRWNSNYDGSFEVRAYQVGFENVEWCSYIGNTTNKFITTQRLVPGTSYYIVVTDALGRQARKYFLVPSAGSFQDGKLKATSITVDISYRRKEIKDAYRDAQSIPALYASEIQAEVDGLMSKAASYGLYYNINYGKLAYGRNYNTLIVFRDSNGFVVPEEVWEDKEYSADYVGHHWYCTGMGFFYALNQAYGYIPSGEYYVDLYWDGMLVNTSSFQVH